MQSAKLSRQRSTKCHANVRDDRRCDVRIVADQIQIYQKIDEPIAQKPADAEAKSHSAENEQKGKGSYKNKWNHNSFLHVQILSQLVKTRHRTSIKPIANKTEKISLLFFASHVGRNISKPTLELSVYFCPNKVSGHFHLKISRITASAKISPTQNQTNRLTRSNIPVYSM